MNILMTYELKKDTDRLNITPLLSKFQCLGIFKSYKFKYWFLPHRSVRDMW